MSDVPMMKNRELGSLQEKIIEYLAFNTKSNKREIQRGLDYPDSQYNSIYRAVDALKNRGFIISEKGISQKKVQIDLYSCSEKGVIYTISKSTSREIIKILDKYRTMYPSLEKLIKIRESLGTELSTKLFKRLFESFQLFDKKEDKSETVQHTFFLVTNMLNGFSDDERNKINNVILELYPEFKIKITDILSKILESMSNEVEKDE